MSLTALGQFVQARRHLEQSLQINEFTFPGGRPFLFSDSEPGRISALSYLHYCLFLLGFVDQAKAIASEVMALTPQQLYTRVLAQIFILRMHVLERDTAKATQIGTTALALARELGYPYLIGTSSVHTGWALAQQGCAADGVELLKAGLAQLRGIGAKCWLPFYLALLAECHERAGDIESGILAVREALDIIEATGERFWETQICCLKGRFLYAAGDSGAAQAWFTRAFDAARQQDAKLAQLQAAVKFADFLRREHRHVEAKEVLARIYASFTEGFDSADLREAKLLLDELANS
jgi:predicted ATPase